MKLPQTLRLPLFLLQKTKTSEPILTKSRPRRRSISRLSRQRCKKCLPRDSTMKKRVHQMSENLINSQNSIKKMFKFSLIFKLEMKKRVKSCLNSSQSRYQRLLKTSELFVPEKRAMDSITRITSSIE